MAGVTFSGPLVLPVIATVTGEAGGIGQVLKGNATATTVIGTVAVPMKCRIVEVRILVRGSSAHATGGVYDFKHLTPGGSATTFATISKTGGASQQGKVLRERPSTHVTLDAGKEIDLVVATADGAANELYGWVLVEPVGEAVADNSAYVAA